VLTLLLITAAVALFALGYTLGEIVGYDRCWKDLAKDGRRKERDAR